MDEGVQRLQQLLDSGAFNGGGTAAGNGGSGDSSATSSDCNGASSNGSSGAAEGSSVGAGGGGGAAVPWGQLFDLLSEDKRLEEDPQRLPDTGYGHEFEAAVSGVFVQVSGSSWC